MNLPAIIKGNAAAKLERARTERGKVEALLAELRTKRDAVDVAADDYATAYESLDAKVAAQERALVIVATQIEHLQVKAADEAAAAAAVRRAQAIRQVEAMLPERLKIVAEIERAIQGIPALFARLDRWQRDFVKRYPADVEHPYLHFIDPDRVLQNTLSALRAIRVEDAGEAITGLAANEAVHHAELIEDLTNNPAPEHQSEAA